MTATAALPATDLVTDADVAGFAADGFVALRGLLTASEVATWRAAALARSAQPEDTLNCKGGVFRKLVNVWRIDPALRGLTFLPRLAACATRLGGRPMRLWHDHLLIKEPRNGVPTHFHQDQPYWPIPRDAVALSAWIALGDVPVEHGCMAFIPGSHRERSLPPQNLGDPRDLLRHRPDWTWQRRVTLPLRAGDCTFHAGFTAHSAGPNEGDEARVAHVVIFVERDVRFRAAKHVVTDGLGLQEGDRLPDDVCPPV